MVLETSTLELLVSGASEAAGITAADSNAWVGDCVALLLRHGAPANRAPGERRAGALATRRSCLLVGMLAHGDGARRSCQGTSPVGPPPPPPRRRPPRAAPPPPPPPPAGAPPPIYLAARNGFPSAVEALVAAGAALLPPGRGDNALMHAADQPAAATAVLRASKDLPKVGGVGLHRAAHVCVCGCPALRLRG